MNLRTPLTCLLLSCFGPACSSDGATREPIRIGLLAPKSGALSQLGETFDRIFGAAIEEINDRGAVRGHELIGVVADTETDPDAASARMSELVDQGVVAVLGPASSASVAAVVAIAREHEIPYISPSSTAPSLIDVDSAGFKFRNVANDTIQGGAQAYYMRLVASPPVDAVAILRENGPYGEGLADSFAEQFEKKGGTVIGVVAYDQNLPSDAAADGVIADLVALAPSHVMMVSLEQDALKIVNSWDRSGDLVDLQWFLTDGVRTSGFLAEIPPSMVGALGTAPTFPQAGEAYGVLEAAYAARFPDFDLGEEVFAPNLWDGAFLLASALATQSVAGESFGGASLRDAIRANSRGPGVIYHAGQWPDLLRSIENGESVDYDGASGPNDFDEMGETVGPYEVWRVIDDGTGGYTYERELYLEASEIQDLLE